MKYISFDIDGVLVDAQDRLRLCINHNGNVDWDCFLDCNKLFMDKPKIRIIKLYNEIRSRGFNIIIVTGRRESMRNCTLKQLNTFNIYGFNGLFMRPDDNTEPDPIYKSWMIKRLMERFNIIAHIDDNLNTVQAISRLGIDAVLLS